MKTLPLLLAVPMLAALTCLAQEPAADAPATEAAPAPKEAPHDPAGPPAETPSATQPAPVPAATPARRDPALDLVPLVPGQIVPEPTLTPENPDSRPAVRPPTGTAPAVKTSKTEVAEKDLADRIRFRQAQTRALADAAVQREWDSSVIARTDLQKREALKRYYTALYARMTKLDPSIGKLIQTRQAYALHRLDQYKMQPTEALDATESNRRGVITDPFTPDQF